MLSKKHLKKPFIDKVNIYENGFLVKNTVSGDIYQVLFDEQKPIFFKKLAYRKEIVVILAFVKFYLEKE